MEELHRAQVLRTRLSALHRQLEQFTKDYQSTWEELRMIDAAAAAELKLSLCRGVARNESYSTPTTVRWFEEEESGALTEPFVEDYLIGLKSAGVVVEEDEERWRAQLGFLSNALQMGETQQRRATLEARIELKKEIGDEVATSHAVELLKFVDLLEERRTQTPRKTSPKTHEVCLETPRKTSPKTHEVCLEDARVPLSVARVLAASWGMAHHSVDDVDLISRVSQVLAELRLAAVPLSATMQDILCRSHLSEAILQRRTVDMEDIVNTLRKSGLKHSIERIRAVLDDFGVFYSISKVI